MQAVRIRRLTALLALATVALVRGLEAQGDPTSVILSAPVRRSIPAQPDTRHVFVLDSAHLLTGPEIAALQDSALRLQSATGADIAFVTLPTLHGGSVEEAALAIGRAWKVGSAGAPGDPTRNRGLVMLYVPDKKSVAGANLRVEVGRGLEGAITDAGGSRAILEAIKPPFRAKHYGDGFIAGFNVAAALIAAEQPSVRDVPPPPTVRATSGVPWAAIVFETVALFAVIAMIIVRRRRRGSPVLDLTPPAEAQPLNPSAWFTLSQLGQQSSSPASDDDNNRSSGSSSSDTSSSSDGGSFGGGGGFSGGGSSDSV